MFDEKPQINLITQYQTLCIMSVRQAQDFHAFDFSKTNYFFFILIAGNGVDLNQLWKWQ
jgi:hypothetical protein